MVRMRTLIAAMAAAIGAFALSPAMATPTTGTFDLISSTCGTGSLCGTVTLSTVSADEMQVTINLNTVNGILFAKTGAGDPVDFSVTGVTASDISISFPSGSVWSASGTSPSFKLLCATCHGTSDKLTSLTFFITDTSANGLENMNVLISEMDIGGPGCFQTNTCSNTSSRTFTTQPCAPNGNCTNGNPTPLPEPLTISLFGAGLVGIGAIRRRRTQKSA